MAMSATAASDTPTAIATSFGETPFRDDDCGKIREEIFAGNVAKAVEDGGGGGDAYAGKNGCLFEDEDENGNLGCC